MTDYAVAARYPGPSEPVSVEDYERALATARAVVSWVEGLVSATGALKDLATEDFSSDGPLPAGSTVR